MMSGTEGTVDHEVEISMIATDVVEQRVDAPTSIDDECKRAGGHRIENLDNFFVESTCDSLKWLSRHGSVG